MEELIKELRKNGEEVIDWIVSSFNMLCGDNEYYAKTDFMINALEYLKFSCNTKHKLALGFICLDDVHVNPVISEVILQRKAKEIMEKRIKELRAQGDKNIKEIISLVNVNYEDSSKERKNFETEMYLNAPMNFKYPTKTYSLGFIELDEKKGIPVINEDKFKLVAEQMTGIRVDALREILPNKEISFIQLDKILKINGYYGKLYKVLGMDGCHSMPCDKTIKNIKKDLKVVYTARETGEPEVEIYFEITKNNGPDEIEEDLYLEDFYLRVTGIKRI